MKESSNSGDSTIIDRGRQLTDIAFTVLLVTEHLGTYLFSQGKYTEYLGILHSLCEPFNTLFDEVKVCSECQEKTGMYQRLIHRAFRLFDNFIDFSKLQKRDEDSPEMKQLIALYERLKGLKVAEMSQNKFCEDEIVSEPYVVEAREPKESQFPGYLKPNRRALDDEKRT